MIQVLLGKTRSSIFHLPIPGPNRSVTIFSSCWHPQLSYSLKNKMTCNAKNELAQYCVLLKYDWFLLNFLAFPWFASLFGVSIALQVQKRLIPCEHECCQQLWCRQSFLQRSATARLSQETNLDYDYNRLLDLRKFSEPFNSPYR